MNKKGSILIFVLVVVLVVSTLAISLSVLARSRVVFSSATSEKTLVSLDIYANVIEYLSNTLATNVIDKCYWQNPSTNEIVRIFASYPFQEEMPALADEMGKMPILLVPIEARAKLIRIVAPNTSLELATAIATSLDDVKEERTLAALSPYFAPDIFLRVVPFITLSTDKININTVSPEVMMAIFTLDASATRLVSRIIDYRRKGGVFSSFSEIASDLGGLTDSENMLLLSCKDYLCTSSNVFSGYATHGNVTAHFIYDADEMKIISWSE